MTPDMLKRIFEEDVPDFSAELCPGATFSDLDTEAVRVFRLMWERRAGSGRVRPASDTELLANAELITDAGITYAALILFGTQQALGQHLAQAEMVFEYRSSEASGPAQQREEYRRGFFSFLDELWQKIDLRNERQHFQQGFFMFDVPTFNEVVIREALLNAVSHRDYRLSGSVFVRQFPRRIEIVSPGSFPPGVTPENILFRQVPRNRRVAEAFGKCGLVERSGQGMNRMFEECIKESKATPDFSGSDDYQVSVTLHGDVQDPRFLEFMERIGQEQVAAFTTDDFLVIGLIHREAPIPERLKGRLPTLVDRGVIEMIGRGRGSRCILSSRFYDFIGKKGVYTRRRGLDRETNKALLMMHIKRHEDEGSQFAELRQVLPALTDVHIQGLVRELKEAGHIVRKGRTKGARWFPSRQDSKQ
jgi:ATP-dependent DNA helicase RecG